MSTLIPALTPDEMANLLKSMQESLLLQSRQDLLHWLQGEIQRYLPHELLYVARGDLATGQCSVEVLSAAVALTGLEFEQLAFATLAVHLHERWKTYRQAPFALCMKNAASGRSGLDVLRGTALDRMRSVVVHGLRDSTGGADRLYLSLSAQQPGADAHRRLAMLLPFIDGAVQALGGQAASPPRRDQPAANEVAERHSEAATRLSAREAEIMRWVRAGKTNQEIGLILDISAFTVKNHLQRIFRKIDVINRAQAVARLDEVR
ncbi:MAG: hypothetical protein JNJ60_14655 [Rhodocyclaceae bacterium]|nr:hypothetical protein [Rhodocyclaceae bacterium]